MSAFILSVEIHLVANRCSSLQGLGGNPKNVCRRVKSRDQGSPPATSM
ncbi:hypothetical protein [Geomicrobium sp. JCM 19037]|nr:hypothetical protein [Geomicrobium sp. JCM 19037]